jgi:hypothetical protein
MISGYHNIWLLKPSELSWGRGIKCYKDINKILE